MRTAVKKLKPGVRESKIRTHFQPVVRGTCGIVDFDEYRAEGYVSRTYWIGYRWYDFTLEFWETENYVAINVINGKIESLYWP